MYGIIRRYKIDPANMDEIVRRVEQGLLPQLTTAPGFVSYRVWLADNGDGISISFFDEASQAEASSRMAAGWVRENLAELMPNPPQVTIGEVRLREFNRQEEPRYGVMRRYQVDPSNADEIVRRAQLEFLPLVSKLDGFASYTIVDVGSGMLVTLSGFRDQASADASTAAAASWVKERLAQLVPNPPEVTRAESKLGRIR